MTDLPERLRSAADAHRPDRERMLARVEHAMAADGAGSGAHAARATGHDRPHAAPWMRVTAVTAAVAGAIGIGGLAVGAVTGNGEPTQTVVTSGSTGTTQPPPTASDASGSAAARVPVQRHSGAASGHHKDTASRAPASHTPTVSPPLQQPSASLPGTAPGPADGPTGGSAPAASNGPLSSDGTVAANSNDYWTQSDVVLTAGQTLTSLTVELRIARNNGETSTGSWTSVSDRTSAQTTVEGQDIVYRWTLNAGQTMAAGTYTFSGQFNHAQGQGGTDGDRYTVTAGYGSGATATVSGGF
jgi:hypothetical protein